MYISGVIPEKHTKTTTNTKLHYQSHNTGEERRVGGLNRPNNHRSIELRKKEYTCTLNTTKKVRTQKRDNRNSRK